MLERRPAEVFHPGEFLLDELEERNWTQAEFAEIIGRPYQLVNGIIKGRRSITPETAKELGAALGTSAEFWLNLEIAYQLWKLAPVSPNITRRAKMRTQYPVKDMILRNWIQRSEDPEILESQLNRHFEISSLEETPQLAGAAMAKRTEDSAELSPVQLAWLYRVKHIAKAMPVPKYSKKKLISTLEQLSALRGAPEEIRHVPQLLAECGVRLVIVESLPSSKIDGVCLWLESSPVIGLSIRFDRIDNFWFVLRHEIEHVLNEDGRDTSAILDSDVVATRDDEDLPNEEKAANAAAAEFCVSQEELKDFIARVEPFFSWEQVLGFAKRLGVHPGLVVGQLQWRVKRYDLFRKTLVSIRDIITPVAMTDGYGHISPIQV